MKTRLVLGILVGLILGNIAVSFPAIVCTPFGTLTSNLSLCQPAQGEIPWDAAYNNNFKVLDSLFPGALTAGNGKLLIGNGAGFALNPLTGTANQITVTNGAGSITLATPQNLDTGAAVQFGSALLRILRFTQVTKPTCLDVLGANVCGTALTLGSDSALQFVITPGIAAKTRGLTITFNVPFAQPPACFASWDGTLTYGYYVQAVSTSTTTAIIRLGGAAASADPLWVPSWGPFDKGSLLCSGVQ